MIRNIEPLPISYADTRKARTWKNETVRWKDLVYRLREPHRLDVTMKEYKDATANQRAEWKDTGGYVAAHLTGGKRKPKNVESRSMLTLDIDHPKPTTRKRIAETLPCAYVLHSTCSSTPKKPRYRLIVPLSRDATAAEYIAVSRRIAGAIDIEIFDNTGFQPYRMMYWPSVPSDAPYIFHEEKGEPLSVDYELQQYEDWRDISQHPVSVKHSEKIRLAGETQQDPTEKQGIIGAFCRAYDIDTAIATFIPEEYVPDGGRYTYVHGSTSCGVVTYENKFSYSHHDTDPAGGMLCNAFDLIRVHKFGHLDEGSRLTGAKRPSHKAMTALATKDTRVRVQLGSERASLAKTAFQRAGVEPAGPLPDVPPEKLEWMQHLTLTKSGKYETTAGNISLILENDPRLKKAYAFNELAKRKYLMRSVPWRKIARAIPHTDVDAAGLRAYLEIVYGVSSAAKVEDAVTLAALKSSFDPVRDYLTGLEWDGVRRVDALLTDYLGARDDEYTRQSIRVTLCGAVARVMQPGCKFDLMLVLVGPQGTGKSEFFRRLGKRWFSDSFHTLRGNAAFEQLSGAWIIEAAELSGMKNADMAVLKHFITKQEDIYRKAYGRETEVYPRRCILVGTTNPAEFLRDPTGARRFLPVDTSVVPTQKGPFQLTARIVDQIWAEAVTMYRAGQPLYLTGEAVAAAEVQHSLHEQADERKGIISTYLDTPIPRGWDDMPIYARRLYLDDIENAEMKPNDTRSYRKTVCVSEVLTECFRIEKGLADRRQMNDVRELLGNMDGWVRSPARRHHRWYGRQRVYIRQDEAPKR